MGNNNHHTAISITTIVYKALPLLSLPALQRKQERMRVPPLAQLVGPDIEARVGIFLSSQHAACDSQAQLAMLITRRASSLTIMNQVQERNSQPRRCYDTILSQLVCSIMVHSLVLHINGAALSLNFGLLFHVIDTIQVRYDICYCRTHCTLHGRVPKKNATFLPISFSSTILRPYISTCFIDISESKELELQPLERRSRRVSFSLACHANEGHTHP